MASRRVLSMVARRGGRSLFTATRPVLEKHVLKVPSMGDSITEGTIVEWTAKVGQAVKAEDVVALVETDKVTVEIKAERGGVITEQFGAVNDTVEVGANLYTIDTDAVPTKLPEETQAAAKPAPAAASAPTTAPTSSTSSSSTSHRAPMIHFLGKDGWEARRQPQTKQPQQQPQAKVVAEYLPLNYGRPKFTEKEMEALILGGASIAPEVTRLSAGASFK